MLLCHCINSWCSHSLNECTVLPRWPQGTYKKARDEIEKGCKVIKDIQQQDRIQLSSWEKRWMRR